MSKLLNVSSSPHVRSSVSTQNLMYDVAIAMLPATIWGVMQFGFYSLAVSYTHLIFFTNFPLASSGRGDYNFYDS